MKRFYALLAITIAFLCSFSASAQLVRDLHYLYNPSYFYNPQNTSLDTSNFSPARAFKPGDAKYNFEIGTSYSTFGGGLSSSYISPTVSFMATSKLHIVAGGKFSYANMGGIAFADNTGGLMPQQQITGNPTEAFAYAQYQLNDKFSIYGMGSFGKNQLYLSPFQSGISTGNYNHLSLGMDYKISEKVKIGASFGITNGPAMGWGYSPMSNYGFQRYHPFFP